MKSISPLIHYVVQTLSVSIQHSPASLPLAGYKLLPGLINTIALVKDTFQVIEKVKDPNTSSAQRPGNLLDCLQALTSEGVDFARERVFETPHPYPQSDYTQSDTIEVPKAIGFLVELDRRCAVEHSSDSLVMYSGSDHIY
jgi:hypothetical protein